MTNVNTLSVLFQMAYVDWTSPPPQVQGGPPTVITSRSISLTAFVSDVNHALGDDVGGDVLQYSGTLNYVPAKRIVLNRRAIEVPAFSGDVTSPGGGKMAVTIAAEATGYYTMIDAVQLLSGNPPSPPISVSFAANPPDGAASPEISAKQLLNILFAGSGTANGRTYAFSIQLDQYSFLDTGHAV
jgi:hypothetical protein